MPHPPGSVVLPEQGDAERAWWRTRALSQSASAATLAKPAAGSAFWRERQISLYRHAGYRLPPPEEDPEEERRKNEQMGRLPECALGSFAGAAKTVALRQRILAVVGSTGAPLLFHMDG